MSTLMLEAAREYFRRRWSPIPVPHKSKNPGFKRWQNMRLTEAELTRHFNGNQQNIGILLGEASVGLVDVDLDVTEAVTLAQKLLPQTTTFGHKSKRHSHYLFQTDPIPATAKFTDTDGTMLAELRSSGSQTILPPSTHPSGEQIEWDRDGDPTLIGGNELHKCVAHLATAAILVRHYPSKGSRESAALALAGGMLRGGLNENEVEDFIEAICHAANDEETRSRVKTVVHTSNRLKAGTDATGWPTLAKIIGDNVVNRVREWLGLLEKNVAVSDKEWDQPEPLPDDLLPVPALPEALIPTPVCPWLSDIAERIQCSLEFPTVAAIIAVAAVIGNRISICPKRRDEWKVIPNLWGAIIGRPGLLKSPALKEALRPLNHLVTQARREYTAALEKWEFDQMVIEARKKGLRAEIEKAVKKDGDVSDLRDQLKELKENEPIERRYIVNDPTVEKLGELLNQNPLGLLLFRDELVGWFRSLDRDGHENDRAFYLEAWNGFGRYTYDRIGRGTIHIESITLSILGGIQPGPLSQYLRGALSGEIGADGLMQRFQLSVYPDPPREWRNVDRWPDVEAQRLVFDLFAHLDVFDPSTIPASQMSLTACLTYVSRMMHRNFLMLGVVTLNTNCERENNIRRWKRTSLNTEVSCRPLPCYFICWSYSIGQPATQPLAYSPQNGRSVVLVPVCTC